MLKESADLGSAVAQYDLGQYYESEKYYQKDSMLYWYRRSAKQGYEDAVVRMNRYPDFYAINKHGDTIYYSINADSISVSITYLDDQHPYGYKDIYVPKKVVPDAIFDKSNIDASVFSPVKNQRKYRVLQVGYHAFARCNHIQKITLPRSVTMIDNESFRGCDSLRIVSDLSSVFCIGNQAFRMCNSLASLSLPSVMFIYDSAFQDCESLKEVKSPSFLEKIGAFAFSGCRGLESIKIPKGVTYIGASAFDHCKSLKEVELPDSLKTIEESAFFGCSGLDSIKIPTGVKIIKNGAFSFCENLQVSLRRR